MADTDRRFGDGKAGAPLRWHRTLMARVAMLCVVLILCLLGSVYLVTGIYYGELMHAMEQEAIKMAGELTPHLLDDSVLDLEGVQEQFRQQYPGLDQLAPLPDATTDSAHTVLLYADQGRVYARVHYEFSAEGRPYGIVMSYELSAQTELVRAFKNKYVAALTLLFFVALGFMIYLVVRTLRPLTELSESCAQISQGNLRDVVVRKNSDEIVSLERSFNRMVASLREKEVVEANLRQAQRLSALGNLAAGVAHDIRNPLNAIKLLSSHTEDLVRHTPEAETATKQLQTIRTEVDRLEEIVSGFLSLAKERELEPVASRVDGLLKECVRLVQKDAEARDVRLTTELRCGDLRLLLDPKQWARAILNVLINALEACPPGGRVRVFSWMTETECEIEIRDDGPGIPKEVIEHAFDPYFTTKTTGTGLGLSITRGIIEEHGGSISISSSEGQGAQVLISVPLTRRV
jgi:signal transduction histidine kinase